ncbi:hypothetical protein [Cohnella rhizosphaerae]|uniref:Uncharacterized protein n=1 Tax=Cohnella rhizosphaerae TaxID=1457232 RepID=A0A9X4KYS4_9BACL|nr:hypothetical protein [Cohnella rhizosphaerae]MDG0813844.1 hypothetical protein [Cohnella rhizosphaerae]
MVSSIAAALPASGAMLTGFAAGVATPATLKPIVCAAALFNLRFAVAMPFANVTPIVFGPVVKSVPLKLP